MQAYDFKIFEQKISEAADGGVGDVKVLQDGLWGVRPQGRHEEGEVDSLALYRDGVETFIVAGVTNARRLQFDKWRIDRST